MRDRYRFVTMAASGRARRPGNRPTHVWRLDRETGEAWHWLASDGEQAREIIADLRAHPENARP